MNKIATRLLIIRVFAPYFSMAWGMLGHRIAGEIAYSNINATARDQKLLNDIFG